MQFAILFSLILAFSPSLGYAKSKAKDAVLLSQVKSLTLRDGKKTTHRRVPAIPQLTCVGGSAQGLYNVDVMRCENSGAEYDSEDIQWTCKASLPPEFKLGSTEVVCEGYDSPDDPFILKGSCGVEYRLILTELGEQRYGKKTWTRSNHGISSIDDGGTLAAIAFWIVFLGVAGFILYKVITGARDGRWHPRGGGRLGWNGGGGGGGGNDGHDDPPPPYTPRAPKPKSEYRANRQQSTDQSSESWRPGFWTGAAAGAAAGYAANAWQNRNNRSGGAYQSFQYQDPQVGSSNWFSRTRNPVPPNSSPFGGGSSYFNRPSSSDNPTFSSSRQESTGFGGTRRR